MIAPIIVLLMMGVIEFGLILFTYASAQNTTRNVVRMLATNQISTTEAQSDCLNGLPTWVNGSASVSIVESAPSDPSSNMITVEISFPAEKATPTNVLSWAYGSLTIHAESIMHQEAAT